MLEMPGCQMLAAMLPAAAHVISLRCVVILSHIPQQVYTSMDVIWNPIPTREAPTSAAADVAKGGNVTSLDGHWIVAKLNWIRRDRTKELCIMYRTRNDGSMTEPSTTVGLRKERSSVMEAGGVVHLDRPSCCHSTATRIPKRRVVMTNGSTCGAFCMAMFAAARKYNGLNWSWYAHQGCETRRRNAPGPLCPLAPSFAVHAGGSTCMVFHVPNSRYPTSMSNWSPPQRIYSGVKHKLEDSASISSGRIWNGKYPGLASSPTWEISAWPGWRRCLAAANPVATRGIVACMCVMVSV
mmetsp:Transcript_8912/g.32843  ORF Transcript_8912/g.32843 Transcript_8912/m.32843 type:complete len:296 (+) Transcript_8912:1502-2389(+)